eukprot:7214162-Prymnesium_polylepis.1
MLGTSPHCSREFAPLLSGPSPHCSALRDRCPPSPLLFGTVAPLALRDCCPPRSLWDRHPTALLLSRGPRYTALRCMHACRFVKIGEVEADEAERL